MISEAPTLVLQSVDVPIYSSSVQFPFSGWDPIENPVKYQCGDKFKLTPSHHVTHGELQLQPYLIPYPIIEETEGLVDCIQAAIEHFREREEDLGTASAKVMVFDAISRRIKQIPAYVNAEDVANLRIPNPLIRSLDLAFGRLYMEWKSDEEVKRYINRQQEREMHAGKELFLD